MGAGVSRSWSGRLKAAPTKKYAKEYSCRMLEGVERLEHLRKHAFKVIARDTSDMSGIKQSGRIPQQLMSCHTAFVNGYVIEGHVPAEDIRRLLAEKPKIAGLAVAGMPVGSPGMEVGNRKDRYDVIAFNRDGTTSVYARH